MTKIFRFLNTLFQSAPDQRALEWMEIELRGLREENKRLREENKRLRS